MATKAQSVRILFERRRMLHFVLVAAAIALVVWIRLLPLHLPSCDEWGDRLARQDARRIWGEKENTARKDADFARWLRQNEGWFEKDRAQIVSEIKSSFSFPGNDGRQHVYLGDFDSYHWLRMAQNYLDTGTTCDKFTNGECVDTFTHAPVGRRNRYYRSLHIAAIVLVHRCITFFHHGYPLSSSAFFVPVIIGALAVIPAYAIGCTFSGELSGFAAAVLIGVSPIFLERTMGSDDDVWNIALPLFIVWAIVKALNGKRWQLQCFHAVTAAVLLGLQALTWDGWPFIYLVVIAGLVALMCLKTVRAFRRSSVQKVWNQSDLRRCALVTVTFYLTTALCTEILARSSSYALPFKIAMQLRPRNIGSTVPQIGPVSLWPNVFTTVGEIAPMTVHQIASIAGGRLLLFGGCLGLLLSLLPKSRLGALHRAVLVVGIVCFFLLVAASNNLTSPVAMGLCVVPLLMAFLVRATDSSDDNIFRSGSLFAVVWFLAGLHLSFSGNRFIMLLVPPCAFGVGILLARLHSWISSLAKPLFPHHMRIVEWIVFGELLLILILPVQRGYSAAQHYVPSMNTAWWKSFSAIRTKSPVNSIVYTWWDYGYWAKFEAQRPVAADGGSLQTHIPYWLGMALMSPDEKESIGALRMLSCGSDAFPEPEGRQGALGKLMSGGLAEYDAADILHHILPLTQEEARRYLEQRGITGAKQETVLDSTHCDPPPSYLVLSTQMDADSVMNALSYIGEWDVRRAYIVNLAGRLPEAKAVQQIVSQLGISPPEADVLFKQAKSATKRHLESYFISARARYVTKTWVTCLPSHAQAQCRIDAPLDDKTTLETISYDFDSKTAARLHLKMASERNRTSIEKDVFPELTIFSSKGQSKEVWSELNQGSNLGVLIDTANHRVLIGTPSLLRSTFTRLVFLHGEQSPFFHKVDDEFSFSGEEVTTWQILWDTDHNVANLAGGSEGTTQLSHK